jgi:hypothetical protein
MYKLIYLPFGKLHSFSKGLKTALMPSTAGCDQRVACHAFSRECLCPTGIDLAWYSPQQNIFRVDQHVL